MSKLSSEPASPVPLIWTLPPPPARQRALGRDEIVAAAIALADEGGADALTMQAVAARLGPYSAMALYRYVHSKDGLIDLMLDTATAEIPVAGLPGPDWRRDLHELAVSTRQMTTRHPWYAALFHTRPPAGPHMMRRLEFMLAVLAGWGATSEGDDLRRADRPAHLRQRAAGSRGSPDEPRRGLETRRPWPRRWPPCTTWPPPPAATRTSTSWLATRPARSADEQFALGLGFLLDGFAARLLPANGSRPTG